MQFNWKVGSMQSTEVALMDNAVIVSSIQKQIHYSIYKIIWSATAYRIKGQCELMSLKSVKIKNGMSQVFDKIAFFYAVSGVGTICSVVLNVPF